jgi:hypothetical protein
VLTRCYTTCFFAVSLNDGHIFDIIFSDEYLMDIVGALEYDSELSTHQHHRKYLREQVVFKEAVPIRDPAILSKIHQTYRIGYIKVVLIYGSLPSFFANAFLSIYMSWRIFLASDGEQNSWVVVQWFYYTHDVHLIFLLLKFSF